MKQFWRLCISLEICLGLLALICCTMGLGSFLLSGEYATAINAMPLLSWLRDVPAGISWWLWLTVTFLALLAANTVFCSIDTLQSRWSRARIVPLIAPQLMHAGFLLIIVAHLQSALTSYREQIVVSEGSVALLPDGTPFAVSSIKLTMSPMGMPTGFSTELATDPNNPRASQITISPNHPWLSENYGVYIKQAEGYPSRRALLEIHREPGAGMALAGALLFTAGNVLLLYLRSRAGEYTLSEIGT
jgi:hypothetical protein